MRLLVKLPQLLYPGNYRMKPWHSNDYRREPRPIGSIALVVEGGANYSTPDGDFELQTGDLLFIPPGGTYISQWGESGGRMLVVHFSPEGKFGVRYPVQKLEGMQELEKELAAILKLFESTGTDFEAAEQFYSVCRKIWGKLSSFPKPQIDSRILPALEFLEKHLSEPVKVEELSALCHMSTSHFFACFKHAEGISPIEYRKQMLIGRAQRYLLEEPEMPIAEISERLGFESDTYFRRVFRGVVGCSPREFRRRGQGM